MAAASPSTAKPAASDRKLQLKELLDWMVEDGHIDAQDAQKIHQEARLRPGRHPIVNVAEAKLRSKKLPSLLLGADIITEWVALKVKMQSYRIDPLKIDLRAVTQVMS